MVELRRDIFPNLKDDVFSTRNETLKIWIHEVFESFKGMFSSTEELINYLNSFSNPLNVELFIRLSQFYGISKIYQESPYVKLIMMVSIIEKLTNKEKKYIPFKDWIFTQDNKIEKLIHKISVTNIQTFKKIVQSLKNDYHKDYGSQRNVVNFFDKYVSLNDKVKIIKSFKMKEREVVYQYCRKLFTPEEQRVDDIKKLSKYGYKIMKIHIPICYDWKWCYVSYNDCAPEIYCLLKDNENICKRALKKIVSIIYSMRSDFVHNAKIPPISEKGINFTVGLFKDEIIIVELSIDQFENIFERSFKKYFDSARLE